MLLLHTLSLLGSRFSIINAGKGVDHVPYFFQMFLANIPIDKKW